MGVTVLNPFSNDTQVILGPKLYLHLGAGWIDFGSVKDLDDTEDIDQYEYEGFRSGQREIYGTVPGP